MSIIIDTHKILTDEALEEIKGHELRCMDLAIQGKSYAKEFIGMQRLTEAYLNKSKNSSFNKDAVYREAIHSEPIEKVYKEFPESPPLSAIFDGCKRGDVFYVRKIEGEDLKSLRVRIIFNAKNLIIETHQTSDLEIRVKIV